MSRTWLALAIASQLAASTATIIRESPHEIVVEWLRRAADGGFSTLGRRALPHDSISRIDVVSTADHWVRFSTLDRGPVTVSAMDLLSADDWHLPDTPKGVDMILWSTTGSIRQPAGVSALITADNESCRAAEAFSLAMVGRAGDLFTTTEIARCRWVVTGLDLGPYEASLRHARGIAGRQNFITVLGKTTEVTIRAPTVIVSGTVLVNTAPVADSVLQFSEKNGRGRTITTVRPDGTYEVILTEPGDYVVTLRTSTRRPQQIEKTFERGPNTFDWDVDDPPVNSRVTIRVSGIDRSAPTAVEIQSADKSSLLSKSIAAGEDTLVERGVDFGRYRLMARQEGAASDWQTIELTADQPDAAVDLVLTRAARTLTLRYVDGEPATNAGFSMLTNARPEEISPGTYSLAAVPPQTEMVIRPPFGAPLCKIVHAVGDVQAVAAPKRALTLRFESTGMTAADVAIRSESMDCPVPLERFLKTPFVAGPNRTTQVEVLNAPADDRLLVHARGVVYQVLVSGDGIVFIPAKQ